MWGREEEKRVWRREERERVWRHTSCPSWRIKTGH
jgi:hypothetical protein